MDQNVQWFDGYVNGKELIARPFPAIAAGLTGEPESTLQGGAYGTAQIVFAGNVVAGDVITVNGTAFTVVASGATGNQFNRGTTLSASIDNMVSVLNASVVAGVAVATYSKVSTTTLFATYDTRVAAANTFTFAANTTTGATITQVTGAVKATGGIVFANNPTADDTITINGTAFTYKASGATGNQINIGEDLPATLTATVTVLNASVVAGVATATYSDNGTDTLVITYDTYGTTGNSFTVAASADTPIADTLKGGVKGLGGIEFAKNPSAGDVLTINGTAFEFVASGASGEEINVGANVATSVANAVTVLNASSVEGVALATYSSDGEDKLIVTYDESTLSGSAYTLAATVVDTDATITQMTNGGADVALDVTTEYNKITTTGKVPAQYFTLADGKEGQKKTIYLFGKGSGNVVITPANASFSTVTFDADKEYVDLKFLAGRWINTATNATVA